MNDRYDIAVAGAGFSGLMTVAGIMRRAEGKLRIFWTDPEAALGFGLAYSTYEPHHLLNVRADRMGAWADGIDDFWRWLQKSYPGQYQAGDFAPRRIYGEYLGAIRDRFDMVPLETLRVKSAKREGDVWALRAGKRRITARHLVLATGNPPIAGLGWPGGGMYISNFWAWRLEGHSAGGLPPDAIIVIAGTGLTAADAVLSVRSDGFRGRIVCVSPHGHWPCVHAPVEAYTQAAVLEEELKKKASARHYLNTLRRHVTKDNWRSVIDSLRPYTQDLWAALPETEKGRFMRHLWSRWNVHRHRMAPQIDAAVADVNLIAGRIVDASADGTVTVRRRGGRGSETIKAALVLNCTGPSYRRMVAESSLLTSLMEQGLLKPGPLGLGISTPDAPGLYAIGTPLLGEYLETTAVPELRGQAAAVAEKILSSSRTSDAQRA